MPKRTSDFREGLLADLADPEEAAHYLNAALEDSETMALIALRDVAEARQMAKVAKSAGVAREALYRMLCETGNPTFENLFAIVRSVGLRLEFAPLHRPVRHRLQSVKRKHRSAGMQAEDHAHSSKGSSAENTARFYAGHLPWAKEIEIQAEKVSGREVGMSSSGINPKDIANENLMELELAG